MSQLDQQVNKLSDKVCTFLDGIPSFANGMTDDQYREDNRFPDLSLDALEKNEASASELLDEINATRLAGQLGSRNLLVMDTAEYMLKYYVCPSFSPYSSKYYYLAFDVLPYTFPLSFAWTELSRLPFDTADKAAKHVEMASDYPRFTSSFLTKLEAQAKKGIYLSASAIDSAVSTLRSYAVDPKNHPMSMRGRGGEATPAQLDDEDAYYEQGRKNLLEAAAFLDDPYYRSKAPESAGLCNYPGGEEYYRYLIRYQLNYDLDPEDLHRQGLELLSSAVSRQDKIRRDLGFKGSHQELVESLRGDPRFFAPDCETAERLLNSFIRKYTEALPKYFDHVVSAACRAERLPVSMEEGMTFGYYSPPTENLREGIYYFNGKDISNKCNLYAASLMAHELNPGHHFLISWILENRDMEPILRKCMCNSTNEGWAEYASVFAGEIGLYTDIYDEYGRLEMEKFTCSRMVADTGLNAMGWSLKKASDFMVENSFVNRAQADSEVLRYAANIPAQCLPYRYGSLKMLELRDRYRDRLGEDYDPKNFHSLVLNAGMVPMDALERYLYRETEGRDRRGK